MKKTDAMRNIRVYANWEGLPDAMQMGILHSESVRGKEIFSFEYNKEWIKSENAQMLDPDLQFFQGPQYLNDSKSNFELFLDSSPDRWGRTLMKRKEAALAKEEKRDEKTLFETDYLLGVYDGYRMGGLRFKTDENGPFLNDNRDFVTPPWTSIRELEQISLKLEEEHVTDDPSYLKWLAQLIAPGSSLGGVRPKASVVDTNGQLWIAKFPSKNDVSNVGGWELVTSELAIACGLSMAACRTQKYTSKYDTFLTKRFDRTEAGERLHFSSAMTMLGYTDGHDSEEGANYIEIAEFISTQGAEIEENLEELWRRIVFSISVSNTDDHLRNHGFILTPKGWILSPAYDINPNEDGAGLSLNISDSDNSLSFDLAMEVSKFFRLKESKAMKIIDEVKYSVKSWRQVADKCGISKSDQELKAKAFTFK